ncbi:hypothetical protein PFISCL1PPCAC_27732, partial [Pristionchus fissidentatus]
CSPKLVAKSDSLDEKVNDNATVTTFDQTLTAATANHSKTSIALKQIKKEQQEKANDELLEIMDQREQKAVERKKKQEMLKNAPTLASTVQRLRGRRGPSILSRLIGPLPGDLIIGKSTKKRRMGEE